MKKLPASTTLAEARKAGRHGDSELVHLNKAEVKMLEDMTYGHGLTINPQTGEKEAFLPFLLSMLPTLFPTIGAGLAGATGIGMLANPLVLGAIGSGLGTAIETGDIGKGVMAGLGGAALGGLAGNLGGAAAGKVATDAVQPALAQAASKAGTSGAMALAPTKAASAVAQGGLGGLLGGGMGGMLVGLPGAMLVANDQMQYGETEEDKLKKDRIARARQENFMTPRTVNAAPAGYVHGVDPEFNFFGPSGTLTPVTTRRGYAAGGQVSAQRMPMPMQLTGRTRAQPSVNPSVGIWAGLAPAPVRVPANPTPPVQPMPGPIMGGGGGGMGGMMDMPLGNFHNGFRSINRDMMLQKFAGGGEVVGPGDGTSDSVPAVINGQDPAALSDGEFVVPAMAVAKLGNGSNRAGAQRLQAMVNELLSE